MLVSLSSVRGSPGVSCWSLLLATAWPHAEDRVLVEADCSGGVVSARYSVPAEPGVADFLSAARRGRIENVAMDTVARLLRSETETEQALWVVPAPLHSHDSHGLWSALAGPAATSMAADRRLWVADCGRVWPSAPTEALLAAADLNVVVAGSAVESLVVMQARVGSLPRPVALLVVGRTKHREDELLRFTGADVVWKVPHFSELAGEIAGLTLPNRRGGRSKTWQTALRVADALDRLATNDVAAGDRSRVGRATPDVGSWPDEVTPTPTDAPTRWPGPATESS